MRKLLILRRLLKGLKFRFELILLVTNLSGIKDIKVFSYNDELQIYGKAIFVEIYASGSENM